LNVEQKVIYEISKNAMNFGYVFIPDENATINWRKVIEIALQQRCFPYIYKHIKEYLVNEDKTFAEAVWIRHKIMVDKKIHEASAVNKAFEENNFFAVLVKGFAFSQFIYDDPYMRQFADVDFFVRQQDTILACEIMEKLGYTDFILSMTEKNVPVSSFARYMHYYDVDEKQYGQDRKNLIEIKDNLWNFPSYQALQHTQQCEISDYNFIIFEPEYAFLYLSQNAFINFSADWGVITDYIIRDILDYYCFIIRYQGIFTVQYVKKIEDLGLLYTVTRMLSILREFYDDEAFHKLPKALLALGTKDTSTMLIYPWTSSLLERLFEPQKRIQEFQWIMHQYCFENLNDFYFPSGVMKQKCDYINGFIAYQTQANMRHFFRICFTMPVMFGVDYDTDSIILLLYIPYNYPNTIIDVAMRNGQAKYGEKYTSDIRIYFLEKKAQIISDEIGDTNLYYNMHNNVDILSIIIPKKEGMAKKLFNKDNYFLSFKISLPNDTRQWSSCIASYDNARIVVMNE